jgi:hypothetical protein
MTMTLTYAEAAQRVKDLLAAPRERWSVDFHPEGPEGLVSELARDGRFGGYGVDFEDLSSPFAVHVPGCTERSVSALLDAAADTGLTVTADRQPGRAPRYGIGGEYATAGLMDLRGVVLTLMVEYANRNRPVPAELSYAAARISTSGTHAGGVSFAFAKALKTGAARD